MPLEVYKQMYIMQGYSRHPPVAPWRSSPRPVTQSVTETTTCQTAPQPRDGSFAYTGSMKTGWPTLLACTDEVPWLRCNCMYIILYYIIYKSPVMTASFLSLHPLPSPSLTSSSWLWWWCWRWWWWWYDDNGGDGADDNDDDDDDDGCDDDGNDDDDDLQLRSLLSSLLPPAHLMVMMVMTATTIWRMMSCKAHRYIYIYPSIHSLSHRLFHL